jgi:hypothetical protein
MVAFKSIIYLILLGVQFANNSSQFLRFSNIIPTSTTKEGKQDLF